MDDERLDAIARTLATETSRRTLLTGLLGGAVAGGAALTGSVRAAASCGPTAQEVTIHTVLTVLARLMRVFGLHLPLPPPLPAPPVCGESEVLNTETCACDCVDDGTACAGRECGEAVTNCGETVTCGPGCGASETCGPDGVCMETCPENARPTASFVPGGGNKDAGHPFLLDATGSSDPCGRPLVYLWTCESTSQPQFCATMLSENASGDVSTYPFTLELDEVLTLGLKVCTVESTQGNQICSEPVYWTYVGVQPILQGA